MSFLNLVTTEKSTVLIPLCLKTKQNYICLLIQCTSFILAKHKIFPSISTWKTAGKKRTEEKRKHLVEDYSNTEGKEKENKNKGTTTVKNNKQKPKHLQKKNKTKQVPWHKNRKKKFQHEKSVLLRVRRKAGSSIIMVDKFITNISSLHPNQNITSVYN